MVTRIDESNAPTLVPQEVSRASDNGSSRLDTYRDLAGLLVSGELAGTQSGEFLKIFRSTTAEISLTDLPFEVASMILENRAETMKEFFESWSESLKEQSKLDKEAHQRRELQKSGFSATERHFVSCLEAAERSGNVTTEEVSYLKGDLNLLAADGDVSTTLHKIEPSSDQTQSSLAALEPPKAGGVNLRLGSSVDPERD